MRNYADVTFELSELFYKLKPINWVVEFIRYRITNFVYTIITDIDINNMSGFFFRKNLCYKGKWGKDIDFDEAIKLLGLKTKTKLIYNWIYDFTFLKLPIILGLPTQCVVEKDYEKFYKTEEFGNESIKFEYCVNKNGEIMIDGDGNMMKRIFSQFYEIEKSIEDLVSEINKIS